MVTPSAVLRSRSEEGGWCVTGGCCSLEWFTDLGGHLEMPMPDVRLVHFPMSLVKDKELLVPLVLTQVTPTVAH